MKKVFSEVVEQGQITVGPEGKPCSYIIRVLDPGDLKQVLQLQDRVIRNLERKEYYVPIPETELRFILEGGGEFLGLFIQGQLYAACSLLFDVDYEQNMARELAFNDEELAQVAQFETSLVDPDLRGYKLQCRLAGILDRRLEQRGTARYLFTTVSPFNYASVHTVTSLGLQIAKVGKMYFGWDRYVVYKDLIQPIKLDTANAISIPNTALTRQKQLLRNGYRGFSQCRDEDGSKILYAKMI